MSKLYTIVAVREEAVSDWRGPGTVFPGTILASGLSSRKEAEELARRFFPNIRVEIKEMCT